jgi:hypothetical protein
LTFKEKFKEKLYDNVINMENKFLRLSSWWGLSTKPGSKKMFINEDGSYTVVVEYSRPGDDKDNSQRTGNIEPARIEEIKSYLDKNVTEDYSSQMMDAGDTIQYVKGDKKITVKNNREVWGELMRLVPEYKN